jgi:hypothetical protein
MVLLWGGEVRRMSLQSNCLDLNLDSPTEGARLAQSVEHATLRFSHLPII